MEPNAGSPDRRVRTLERLLAISSTRLEDALTEAADLVSAALDADKVDVFLYDAARDTLTALGSSEQPLSVLQRRHGLDVLAVANGGRAVEVFQTGITFASGSLDTDPEELRGIRQILKVRSAINVALEVGAVRRGVLSIASQKPSFWNADDAAFAEAIAAWVSILTHRAELVKDIERNAVVQGRRAAAEEIVTVLAHDLRGYLAPVDLRLHLLERRAKTEGREADLRDSERARLALRKAEGLIANLLDVARIDQGLFGMQMEPVDLGELVRELSTTLATPDHPVEVVLNAPAWVSGDTARLRQCIQNLLANALKFSPPNMPVSVRIEPSTTIDRVRVEVADQGPGIAPDLAPHIFERFVSETGRRPAGLGLGLYLAKQIALHHGGDLTATSSAQGARFELLLPCAANH